MSTSRRILVSTVALLCAITVDARADEKVFHADLDGQQTQPEPTKTQATGTLELRLAPDGKHVEYKITVHDLSNASAADIHLGGTAQNGPWVAKLFPKNGAAAKKGPYSGVLVEGSLSAADFAGPLAGAPLSDLIDELEAGNVYANVHTSDESEPANSGPGDYRLGEIRGQLK
jgi:hypothetical protein